MPKIFGLNAIALLAASVAFYFVGFLWYGVIFSEAWMTAEGLTAEDAEGQSPIWMAGGFLITILQAIGLGLVLKWRNTDGLSAALTTSAMLWFFLALPFTSYAYMYLPRHDATLLMIDASHLLVGWLAAGAVLALMKAWK